MEKVKSPLIVLLSYASIMQSENLNSYASRKFSGILY